MANRPQTREQQIFYTNYKRAYAAGVVYNTAEQVYFALLNGATTMQFVVDKPEIDYHWVSDPVALDDEYISIINDELANAAIEQGLDEKVKWVGQIN